MGAAHSMEGARLAILDALNFNLRYQELNPFMTQVRVYSEKGREPWREKERGREGGMG